MSINKIFKEDFHKNAITYKAQHERLIKFHVGQNTKFKLISNLRTINYFLSNRFLDCSVTFSLFSFTFSLMESYMLFS